LRRVAALLGPLLAAAALAGCGREELQAVEVTAGLDRPVYAASAPGEPGRLYVVEQAGVVRVVENGVAQPEPFLDIRELVLTSPKGEFASERGLLSLVFARDFASSGRFYVDYTDRSGDVNVVEYRTRGGRADPSSARRLLFVQKRSERHHGGQLQLGPGGDLYVSVGDDRTIPSVAQNPEGPLGTILRLDLEAPSPARWEVVAYGLRNPWRFSFDRETGDLWIGDVGESAWEEVDVLRRGSGLANLGWDAYEGEEEYTWEGRTARAPSGPGDLVRPVAVFDHETGCSVTGGYVYRGEAVPALQGRYLYADYCSGRVWSVDAADPGEPRRELDLGTTLASFGEDEAGELYLVSRTGRIFRLAR
jgi:glucose/arabinose dehydrogenase